MIFTRAFICFVFAGGPVSVDLSVGGGDKGGLVKVPTIVYLSEEEENDSRNYRHSLERIVKEIQPYWPEALTMFNNRQAYNVGQLHWMSNVSSR